MLTIWNAPAKRLAIENPPGLISSMWRKPDQYVAPWQFGQPESKPIGLWLRGLPTLKATDVVKSQGSRFNNMPQSPRRGHERSRFFPGVAAAMADQWGSLC